MSYCTGLVRNIAFGFHAGTLRRACLRAPYEGASPGVVVEASLACRSTDAEAIALRQFVTLHRNRDVDRRLGPCDWTRNELYEERTRWPHS